MSDTTGAQAQRILDDVERVRQIEAVPSILEVICRTTGMGFAAVARVTDERWVACSVIDEIGLGLKPGGELKLETTICNEIRQSREPVVIDNVAEDGAWRQHATPAMYGFQSYISFPIVLADGSFFGTLCALDRRPAQLKKPETVGMFRLFAELIAKNLETIRRLGEAESALKDERAAAEIREQFIAVVGHDLRTPMRAIRCFSELLLKTPLEGSALEMVNIILGSAKRMQMLIENLLDLARGRLGGGLSLQCESGQPLEPALREVIAELRAKFPEQVVNARFQFSEPIRCDRARIAQVLSNLLSNALAYGDKNQPVLVEAKEESGAFELSVENSGEPISPATLVHIFDPFYRGAVLGDREGLGLGLYIAHEIAKAHDGTLTVESTQETTRFTFRIPCA